MFGLQIPAEVGLRTQQGSADHGEPELIVFLYTYLPHLSAQFCVSNSLLHSSSFSGWKWCLEIYRYLEVIELASVNQNLTKTKTHPAGRSGGLLMVGIRTLILLPSHLILSSFFAMSVVVTHHSYKDFFLFHLSFNHPYSFLYLHFWQQMLQRLGCLKKLVFFTVARFHCNMPLAFDVFILIFLSHCVRHELFLALPAT